MDQATIPHWLDAAVQAAGISTIYNAEDWSRQERRRSANAYDHDDPAANDPSAAPH